MKTILSSIAVAFSMYSRIPVPSKNLDDRGMRYALCFFPLIGAVIGFLIMLWSSISYFFGFGTIVKAAGSCVIPILVSGGIHMDGFLDTVDALSSHKSREEKLKILKDTHTGSFAVIYAVVYMILYFAMWTDLSLKQELILSIGFVLSRALSALAVAVFAKAKKSGLLYVFACEADRKMVVLSSFIYIVICAAAFFAIDWRLALLALCASFLAFFIYRVVSYRQFGGITGDLAGFFVCLCELLAAVFVQIGGLIWNL